MTVAELIRPGDKVDIGFVQQIEGANVETPKVYKSQVLDVKENGNLNISMPIEGTKLILLPLGVRMQLVFYTKGGLYRSIGLAKERYKSDNVYTLEIELKTQPEKYQRREFFRYPYILDIDFYTVSEEELKLESVDALRVHLLKEKQKREYKGCIVDLSGGGVRFRTDIELLPDEHLLFSIHLQNERVDKQYYIVGDVVSCTRMEHTSDKKYEIRAKFQIEDSSTREEIIQFIFEEERKERQRGRW